MLISLLAIAGGMVLLVVGAEGLVRGASRLAAAAGISPVIVGLTVVAFGTSAPELAVSVQAALSGEGEVALGNAIGSNIFNILAILGASALFGGLIVNQRIVRFDVPLLIGVTGGVWWLAADGRFSVGEGGALLAAIVLYTVGSYLAGRNEPDAVEAEYSEAFGADPAVAKRTWPLALGLVVGGLAGLVLGAQLLVFGATDLAQSLGVSDLIIGLTVVAVGTSLPELATSVIAARRGERDIAVGNVVGSNLFNLLAVMGAAALAGGGIDIPRPVITAELPVAFLVTLVALPALAIGLRVTRWEGALLLLAYAGYVAVLVAEGSGPAPAARGAVFWALGGLAVLLTVVGLYLQRRKPA